MRCRAGQDNHRGQGKEVTTDQCEEGISEELFKNGEVNQATMKAKGHCKQASPGKTTSTESEICCSGGPCSRVLENSCCHRNGWMTALPHLVTKEVSGCK